jgi:FHA domain-containing protein
MPVRAQAAPGQATAAGVEDDKVSALLAAFLEGLDASDVQVDALTPSFMFRIGALLRESTRGTVDLLVARAALKREVRAELTVIAMRENNPLKFSPTVEIALQHLLGPLESGFTPPIAAMQDAYDDLRAHQVGMVAGMRSALEGVLARFDPARLEAQLAPRAGLAGLLPANRRARLWEAFESLHTQLATEAEEAFHELYGAAFLEAYEAHIDSIKRELKRE